MAPTTTPNFRATYRIQLRKEFTFNDLSKITPYLNALGVSHLYLSPIFESRPGSNHGYDCIDPTLISKERGGEEGFRKLAGKIQQSKSLEGIILDIVPNHVAADSRNPYWWDVLKFGPSSKYWSYFDIRPRGPSDIRLVLPVLGRSRDAVLTAGELKIEKSKDGFVFRYWDHVFPLRQESTEKLTGSMNFSKLPLPFLFEILNEQHYFLDAWYKGSKEINYRRFFDINDLAAIRVEDPEVFEWAHEKIKKLVKETAVVHGLRVDHIDGLTDPQVYLERLQEITPHVWVEKILGDGEKLPSEWKTLGSTGYEFSNLTARIFVDLSGVLHLHSHYIRHIDSRWQRFHDCVYQSKKEILESHFISEITILTQLFFEFAKAESQPNFTRDNLYEALVELTCSLKVYRTYKKPTGDFESKWLEEAFVEAEGRGKVYSTECWEWLRKFMFSVNPTPDEYLAIKRWEQLSGPVMAKGLEDTALYRYFPLLSLNVVGGEPDWSGDGGIEFHAFNQHRLRHSPYAMNTTSTHDTKRSEDVRSRIHVLSDLSDEWIQKFEKWSGHRKHSFPDIHTEYFIYETLIGVWPFDGKINLPLLDRLKNFFIKASREAKVDTSWLEPNRQYENDLTEYVVQLVKPKTQKGKNFIKEFDAFAKRCAYFGAFNSLSLLTLKALSPGLPDFYQGTELWDLSLVDPDNRRPVDYGKRNALLKNLKARLKINRSSCINLILKQWTSGEVKLWLTYELLQLKRKLSRLFIEGEYIPIELEGEFNPHFICFLRKHENTWALVLVPRLLARKTKLSKKLEIQSPELLTASIKLPNEAPVKWKNHLNHNTITFDESLTTGSLLQGLPVGIWVSQ